jgi:hypothetical protein
MAARTIGIPQLEGQSAAFMKDQASGLGVGQSATRSPDRCAASRALIPLEIEEAAAHYAS